MTKRNRPPASKLEREAVEIIEKAKKKKADADRAARVSGLTLQEMAKTLKEISNQLQQLIKLQSK